MRNTLLLILLSSVVLCCHYLEAQDETTQQQKQEAQPPDDTSAQEEARRFEKMLVERVHKLLQKQDTRKAGTAAETTGSPAKATPPQPEPYDKEKLADEIDEWESKALSFTEGLKLQELAELAEEQQQQVKKLAEKILGHERVVVNPNRRPGESKEGARLEKLFHEELGKLRKKHEQEQRRIEREYEREKENIERTARKLRESVKSKRKKEGARKSAEKPSKSSRLRPGEERPPGRKDASRRRKK